MSAQLFSPMHMAFMRFYAPFAPLFGRIELLVTLTVLGILMAVAVPGIGNWISNTKVRSVAESLQNSLRLTQAEALRRGRQTVFVLTNAEPALTAAPVANGSNWYARALPLVSTETADATYYIQGGKFATQSGVTITGPAVTCFTSFGRQVDNASTGLGSNCAAPTSATAPFNFNVARTGSDRSLRIQTYLGGKIRMCDPAKSLSAQPDGCCLTGQTDGVDC